MALSIGTAVGSGFNLIGRRPMAVIGWGAFLLVGVLLIELLAIVLFGLPTPTAAVGAGLTPGALVQQMQAQAWRTIFVVVLEIPLTVVASAAVIRAVLEPENRSFASIRFGAQEGALVLLYLLFIPIWIGLAVVSIIVAIPIGVIGGAVGRAAGGFAGGSIAFVLFVAYGLALLWFALRFSLAFPMTFVEGRVRLLASWEATRGEGWRLFGLWWLLFLVAIALVIGLIIVVFILALIAAGVGVGLSGANFQNLATNPASLAALGPVMLIFALIILALYAFCIGCAQAIFLVPFADAYRQLKGSPDTAATFT